MPNRFINVSCQPTTVKSGQTTTVTVTYTAVAADSLEVSCGDSYAVTPTKVSVKKGIEVTRTFTLTVTRKAGPPPSSARVTFTLFGDARVRVLEVT